MTSSTDRQSPRSSQVNSSSQWQIRPAHLEDVAGVAETLTESFHSREGAFGWAYPLLRLGIYEDLSNRVRSASPYHVCLVAVDVAAQATTTYKVVGTVEMAVRTITPGTERHKNESHCRSGQYPYLSNLAVRPNFRCRGVARQLLENCERIALAWGFYNLYLHVLENNHQARQLYFNTGYQLDRVDTNWNFWLLRKPRQLLLHKHLDSTECHVAGSRE